MLNTNQTIVIRTFHPNHVNKNLLYRNYLIKKGEKSFFSKFTCVMKKFEPQNIMKHDPSVTQVLCGRMCGYSSSTADIIASI